MLFSSQLVGGRMKELDIILIFTTHIVPCNLGVLIIEIDPLFPSETIIVNYSILFISLFIAPQMSNQLNLSFIKVVKWVGDSFSKSSVCFLLFGTIMSSYEQLCHLTNSFIILFPFFFLVTNLAQTYTQMPLIITK